MTTIEAQGVYYRELNEQLRAAVRGGAKEVVLEGVNGQRYIAAGLAVRAKIAIKGVPGNDLGAFMNGPRIEVFGNAQDGVGNTMNEGAIIVHGDAGDVLGYGMRGGKILVRGDVGYRVGIHMKAFKDQVPRIVVGGRAQDFFGEYMAGGILVLLGLDESNHRPLAGAYCGTGLHGGAIYVRGALPEHNVATEHVRSRPITDEDEASLRPLIEEFCELFAYEPDEVWRVPFSRLTPVSHRPFAANYAPNV